MVLRSNEESDALTSIVKAVTHQPNSTEFSNQTSRMKSNRTNRFLGLLRRFLSASAIVMSFLGAAQAASNKYFNSASSGTVWNNATANWGTVSGGPYTSAWATYDFAIFEGTGDTITLTTPTCDRSRSIPTGTPSPAAR